MKSILEMVPSIMSDMFAFQHTGSSNVGPSQFAEATQGTASLEAIFKDEAMLSLVIDYTVLGEDSARANVLLGGFYVKVLGIGKANKGAINSDLFSVLESALAMQVELKHECIVTLLDPKQHTLTQRLAAVLYAPWPELLILGPSDKDTKAGKRITRAKKDFQDFQKEQTTALIAQSAEKLADSGIILPDVIAETIAASKPKAPSSKKDVFLFAYANGTPEEQKVLVSLYTRVNADGLQIVDGVKLTDWIIGYIAEHPLNAVVENTLDSATLLMTA